MIETFFNVIIIGLVIALLAMYRALMAPRPLTVLLPPILLLLKSSC